MAVGARRLCSCVVVMEREVEALAGALQKFGGTRRQLPRSCGRRPSRDDDGYSAA